MYIMYASALIESLAFNQKGVHFNLTMIGQHILYMVTKE